MVDKTLKCGIILSRISERKAGSGMNGILQGYTNEQVRLLSEHDYEELCHKINPPLTEVEKKELQDNNIFYSVHESMSKFNGEKFTINSELYDGNTREDIGHECSSSWIDTEDGDRPVAKSDRLFHIKFNGKDTKQYLQIVAEYEEISGYYIKSKQA